LLTLHVTRGDDEKAFWDETKERNEPVSVVVDDGRRVDCAIGAKRIHALVPVDMA